MATLTLLFPILHFYIPWKKGQIFLYFEKKNGLN